MFFYGQLLKYGWRGTLGKGVEEVIPARVQIPYCPPYHLWPWFIYNIYMNNNYKKLKLTEEMIDKCINDVLPSKNPYADSGLENTKNVFSRKRVYLTHHAKDKIKERFNLVSDNWDLERFISNELRGPFAYTHKQKGREETQPTIFHVVNFGEVPIIFILVENEDRYLVITAYMDIGNENVISKMIEYSETEKADKEYKKELINAFFKDENEYKEFISFTPQERKEFTVKVSQRIKPNKVFDHLEEQMKEMSKYIQDDSFLSVQKVYNDRNFENKRDDSMHDEVSKLFDF